MAADTAADVTLAGPCVDEAPRVAVAEDSPIVALDEVDVDSVTGETEKFETGDAVVLDEGEIGDGDRGETCTSE